MQMEMEQQGKAASPGKAANPAWYVIIVALVAWGLWMAFPRLVDQFKADGLTADLDNVNHIALFPK